MSISDKNLIEDNITHQYYFRAEGDSGKNIQDYLVIKLKILILLTIKRINLLISELIL